MGLRDWLGLRHELPHRRRLVLTVCSFLLPLALWSIVSYVPWIWHPLIRVTDPGGVDYFVSDMEIDRAAFAAQAVQAQKAGLKPPQGYRVNPIYFQPPHAVFKAFYTAFVTPPRLPT